MQLILSIVSDVLRSTLPLFHTSLPSNRDLRSTLPLHRLERVSTRSNQKSEEVDLGELLDGDVDLVLRLGVPLLNVVLVGRSEGGIEFESFVDELDSFVLEFATVSDFSGVGSSTVSVVGRRRGGRPEDEKKEEDRD